MRWDSSGNASNFSSIAVSGQINKSEKTRKIVYILLDLRWISKVGNVKTFSPFKSFLFLNIFIFAFPDDEWKIFMLLSRRNNIKLHKSDSRLLSRVENHLKKSCSSHEKERWNGCDFRQKIRQSELELWVMKNFSLFKKNSNDFWKFRKFF